MILISKLEFSKLHHKTLVACQCKQCGIIYHRSKHHLTTLHNNGHPAEYCSKTCSGLARRKKIERKCAWCGTTILKKPSQCHGEHDFCSCSCSTRYKNKHKNYCTRRSKLEIFLEGQIRKEYSFLEFTCNNRQIISPLELDFYFPTLKFAMELNGIVHYEPIYGDNTLNHVQGKDQRKVHICEDKGIELAVIDASACGHLTENNKIKYWSAIKELLDRVIQNRTNSHINKN